MRRSDFLKALKGPDFDHFNEAATLIEFRIEHPQVYSRVKEAVEGLRPELRDHFLLSGQVLWRFYALYRRDPRRAEWVLSHLRERVSAFPPNVGHRRVKPLKHELKELLANELLAIPPRFSRTIQPVARKVRKIRVVRLAQATAPRVRFRRLRK